jgi:hypothetical protein
MKTRTPNKGQKLMCPANCQSRLSEAPVTVPNEVDPEDQLRLDELGVLKFTWFQTSMQSASKTKARFS